MRRYGRRVRRCGFWRPSPGASSPASHSVGSMNPTSSVSPLEEDLCISHLAIYHELGGLALYARWPCLGGEVRRTPCMRNRAFADAVDALRWHHALVGKGINKGAGVLLSTLIRLGGLASMAGGIIFVVRESLLGRPR